MKLPQVVGEDLFCQILQHKDNQYSNPNNHIYKEIFGSLYEDIFKILVTNFNPICDNRRNKWVIEFWMIDTGRKTGCLNTETSG